MKVDLKQNLKNLKEKIKENKDELLVVSIFTAIGIVAYKIGKKVGISSVDCSEDCEKAYEQGKHDSVDSVNGMINVRDLALMSEVLGDVHQFSTDLDNAADALGYKKIYRDDPDMVLMAEEISRKYEAMKRI